MSNVLIASGIAFAVFVVSFNSAIHKIEEGFHLLINYFLMVLSIH
jgi:hypothetical protein